MVKYNAIKLYYLKSCVLIASKQAGEGEGSNPVDVDTLGPVIRGCLKAILIFVGLMMANQDRNILLMEPVVEYNCQLCCVKTV